MPEAGDAPAAAAWLPAAAADLAKFLEGFVRQLEPALPPGHLEVHRRLVRLLPPKRVIATVRLRLADRHYVVESFGGAPRFLDSPDSRGIALQGRDIGLAEWLLAVERALRDFAQANSTAAAALAPLLGSADPNTPPRQAASPDQQEDPAMPSDLPGAAQQRLQPGASGQKRAFTSDLSINEHLMVRQAGFQPVGLVLGSSIYHVGLQISGFRTNQEIEVGSRAMYNARELAMHRMVEEATQAGADGVVGVRLLINRLAWSPEVLEFVAIGTAIRHSAGQEGFKAADGRPFTSHLSGQDFWTLLQTGSRPLAMVMGCCVYHIAHQGFMQMMRNIGRNAEIPEFTQAYYNARELAMARMQQEADAAGAGGVVGVLLSESSQVWEAHVVEYFALGTAITAVDQGKVNADALRVHPVLPVAG